LCDLPPETSQAIHGRMTSERRREASGLFAAAFSQDPKFFAFYRATETYRPAVTGP